MISTLIGILVASLATALYFIFSRRRRVPTLNIEGRELPPITEALPLITGLTGGVVYTGNRVEIYDNGELLDALLEAIRAAQSNVHLETFVWERGEVERRFVDALSEKAQQGVEVRVLVDFLGASRASNSQLDRLEKSGAQVGKYRPINRFSIRRFNNRMHRKLLIVDGATGFVFGHGIADEWQGEAQDQHHWRDTGIRIEGPLVHGLQGIFSKDWVNTKGRIPLEHSCFPVAEECGEVKAHVVSSGSGDLHSSVAMLYMLAIASAREEIIIQNPYFTPNRGIPELLATMAARGVKVHLMVPGKYTDSPFVRRAGQRLYRRLLEAGVMIYEFQPTLLHHKIVIIDGQWSHIGSTNFDARSLALNGEIGVGLLDRDIAMRLRTAFEKDRERSRALSLQVWRRRASLDKLMDWAAYQLHSQL